MVDSKQPAPLPLLATLIGGVCIALWMLGELL